MQLTALHFVYLFVIILVIVLMGLKHDVVMPCVVGLFVLGACMEGGFNPIRGAQCLFNGMLVAGNDLFDIMLVIALMVAMLRSLEHMGADRMMIAPAAKLIKTPTMAFWLIAAIMYVCATFFWPTPATALVGTILIPIALKAGLNPMLACMALNLAGHGMALSGDLVLQGASQLSAAASGADLEEILVKGGLFATIAGVVALSTAFFMNRKLIKVPVDPAKAAESLAPSSKEPETAPPPYAKYFAILVPVVFGAILVRIVVGAAVESIPKIFGGDATALLGGTAALIMIVSTMVDTKKDFLEKTVEYLKAGMMFSIKIFSAVIPIAAFFSTGNPDTAAAILGEGAPGFLFDLGNALAAVLPLNKLSLALGVVAVGVIAGLDGSGFVGIPLVGGLAGALGGAQGYNVASLAALGQIASVWSGGGCLSAWAFGLVASAGVAGVEPAELVRKNLIPVTAGLAAAIVVGVLMM